MRQGTSLLSYGKTELRQRENITLRALIEHGLRLALRSDGDRGRFKLRIECQSDAAALFLERIRTGMRRQPSTFPDPTLIGLRSLPRCDTQVAGSE